MSNPWPVQVSEWLLLDTRPKAHIHVCSHWLKAVDSLHLHVLRMVILALVDNNSLNLLVFIYYFEIVNLRLTLQNLQKSRLHVITYSWAMWWAHYWQGFGQVALAYETCKRVTEACARTVPWGQNKCFLSYKMCFWALRNAESSGFMDFYFCAGLNSSLEFVENVRKTCLYVEKAMLKKKSIWKCGTT